MSEGWVDGMVVDRSPEMARRVWWWQRALRLRCRDHDVLAAPDRRCERRAGHHGPHQSGLCRWGWTVVPDPQADPHFTEWARSCPLREWTRYEGPRFSCEVFLTKRAETSP